MINLCCVSDFNFLPNGLALYESMKQFDSNFTLHYLCMDDESFELLKELNEDIVAYPLSDFLNRDETLADLATQDYRYFCWSLASYFTNYLMNTINEDITYIDSDILFYDKIETVLNEIGSKDVGLFRHRQYPLSHPNGNGWFNVGVNVFDVGLYNVRVITCSRFNVFLALPYNVSSSGRPLGRLDSSG